jgi:hypothetical protein
VADLCEAKGKPPRIVLRYIGGDTQDHSQASGKVVVTGNPGTTSPVYIIAAVNEDGSGNIFFSGTVTLSQEFIIDGTLGLKSQTFVLIKASETGEVLQTIDFHTSCSQPLLPGDKYGAIQLVGG